MRCEPTLPCRWFTGGSETHRLRPKPALAHVQNRFPLQTKEYDTYASIVQAVSSPGRHEQVGKTIIREVEGAGQVKLV